MSEEMSEERYDTDYILDNLFRASRRLKLNAGEFEVLCALVRHDCPDPRNGGKRKEEVWPSPRQGLHDITGRPRRTVQRVLDRLEKKGAITCLTPDNRGENYAHHWRPNYSRMGWKEPPRRQIVAGGATICRRGGDNLSPESGNPNLERKNPPPPEPPPSSSPAGSPVAPPVLEEEEFPFLSPDERTCLLALQVSPALRQRVRQSEPGQVQAALQHLLSQREDILASGRSLEERFGGLLRGTFVPSPEPEPLREEVPSVPWGLCRACGVTYQGEHECSSLPEGREPPGEEDLWLQRMKERAERAQREARE